MEKTFYKESRKMTKEFMRNIFNEEAIKKHTMRQLVWNIFENLETKDLEKLGFEIEVIDPESDASYAKFIDPQTSEDEKEYLRRLFEEQCIEISVKLLL